MSHHDSAEQKPGRRESRTLCFAETTTSAGSHQPSRSVICIRRAASSDEDTQSMFHPCPEILATISWLHVPKFDLIVDIEQEGTQSPRESRIPFPRCSHEAYTRTLRIAHKGIVNTVIMVSIPHHNPITINIPETNMHPPRRPAPPPASAPTAAPPPSNPRSHPPTIPRNPARATPPTRKSPTKTPPPRPRHPPSHPPRTPKPRTSSPGPVRWSGCRMSGWRSRGIL